MTTFDVMIHQDAPFDELIRRWQTAEAMGFRAAYVCDHSGDYRDLNGYWLDGWTVLAAVAAATHTIRIGPLVTNPVLRPPVAVAKLASSIDALSGGRLELGVGTGIAPFDHAAAGVPYWGPKERVARFREYVEVLDGLLRAAEEPFVFRGDYLQAGPTRLEPPPVQRPRPPFVVAGQSPTVRRVAVACGEAWNTHGPFGASKAQILEVTATQNREIDGWCEAAGRDPASLRRSVLLIGPLDAWAAPDALSRLVEEFTAGGTTEFVTCWPQTDEQRAVFEATAIASG